jgi:hypothetical protein
MGVTAPYLELSHAARIPLTVFREGMSMSQQISKEDARQGKTLGVMRYVLGISFVGAVLAIALAWLLIP